MNEEIDERQPILNQTSQKGLDWETFKKSYYIEENKIQNILKELSEWHSDITKKLNQIEYVNQSNFSKSEPICDDDIFENQKRYKSIDIVKFQNSLEELEDLLGNMQTMLEYMNIDGSESQAKLKNNMLKRFREIQQEHEKETEKLKVSINQKQQQFGQNQKKYELFKDAIMNQKKNGQLKTQFSQVNYDRSIQQADMVIDLANNIHSNLQQQGSRLDGVVNKVLDFMGQYEGIQNQIRWLKYHKYKKQIILSTVIILYVLILIYFTYY